MKRLALNLLILFSFFFGSAHLAAASLPSDHFLYPRDKEVTWMTGIEIGLSFSGNKRLYKSCLSGSSFNKGTYKDFVCELYKNSNIVETSLTDALEEFDSIQVVMVGERHTFQKNQVELAKAIKATSGFDVLALEMFNYQSQSAVNDYLNETIDLQELGLVLAGDWSYQLDGYLEIIKAAKESGLKILALDDRKRFLSANFSNGLILRDQVMANILSEYLLGHPHERILVYSGKLHAFKGLGEGILSIAQILKQEIPSLEVGHIQLFDKNRKNLYFPILPLSLSKEATYSLKSSALKNYTDIILFH
jgi:uncharacterized iron-regulated protein